MKIRGAAWKFGDDVNTDEIIPARYLNTIDPAALAAHCMEDADRDFAKRVRPGDLLVAGRTSAAAPPASTRRSASRPRGWRR